jgi:3-dehydroquinate dehydratase/shikimate dehydrogenase
MERARICLCVAERTLAEDAFHVAALRGRIDMVELRADFLDPEELAQAGRFPLMAGMPVILTIRRPADGGRFNGEERDRVGLLRKLCGKGFAYIDIEEGLAAPSLDAEIRAGGLRVVRSLHDFNGVPPDLRERLRAAAGRAGEIPKAAVTPRTAAELSRLIGVIDSLGPGERVVLGMGSVGFPTRVLASRLGSAWCYTSPPGTTVAPGQIDPQVLEDVYRFRSVSPSTAVYGVIGSPVMHSRSPLIHNSGFAALGIDAVYLPFDVPDLPGFRDVADAIAIRGLSVTVPHKQGVLALLSEHDETVSRVGACNTIIRQGSAWRGTNTDVEGFLAPLRAAFNGRIPAGLGATVIGAGGAARAVVHGLAGAGFRVIVLNRTPEKAQELASAIGASAARLDSGGYAATAGFRDLVVQTTSAGMAPEVRGDPAPDFPFTGREMVYELIYAPGVTPFVRRAQAAGCSVIFGRRMLLSQAMRQFQLFTGRQYPEDLVPGLERGFD